MPLMRDIDMAEDRFFRPVSEVIELAESIGWRLIAHEEYHVTFAKGPGKFCRYNISRDGLIDSHRFQKEKNNA